MNPPVSQQRSHEEHVALFAAFGDLVGELEPESWQRVIMRCQHLDGSGFGALLARARLSVRPFETVKWLSRQGAPAVAAIARISAAGMTGLAVAFELGSEFRTPNVGPPIRRTESTGKRSTDTYVDSYFAIEASVARFQPLHPGVAVAVRAAGQAVLHHDFLVPEDFDAVYDLIEPEIPYTMVVARAGV